MLGLGKPKNRWHWAACGKHPVARDYFRLSLDTALLTAFEDWIEKGYQVLSTRQPSARSVYSWRFWAKGIKKGNLICGVAKDSSDSIGRPYPLLIMGDGMIEGWEDHWDLLPLAFETTWDQIEYISSRRFQNLKGLEHEICAIKPPKPGWPELRSENRNLENPQSPPNALTISNHNDEIKEKAACLNKDMEVLIPLDINTHENLLSVAGHWNLVFKDYGLDVPNAVFLGGVPEKHFLTVYNRPLNSDDFIRLWSVCSI